MKNIIFYFLSILSFSQISQFPNQLNTNGGCFDDDYTISVGMSLYDSSILNCEDAISYLNNFGYGCTTPLDQINNPFWGSNPNETISNICGCYCQSVNVVYGCTDISSCNFNPEATIDDGNCIYAQDYYDCSGSCITDLDNDGLCDELDECVGEYDECGVCNGNGPQLYYECAGNCINDLDNDEVCDELDECVGEYDECGACNGNGPQLYYDCDGNCINDLDNDEVCDEQDNCPEEFNPNQEDFNSDDIGDACDGIGLDEDIIQRKLIKVLDILGRQLLKGNALIKIYEDGSIEKQYILER